VARPVLPRLRTGGWRRIDGGGLAVAATVAAALDVATTTVILYAPDLVEQNRVLATLSAVDPLVAAVGFAAYAGAICLLAWLDLGWVATVAGATLVTVMGPLGLNNLAYVLGGTAPLYVAVPAFGAVVTYVAGPVGFLAGVTVEGLARDLPRREVAAGAAVLVSYEGLLFAAL
jgi:hypothetical protein